ncbi:MAG: response regulator [Burkholderiaceae bacterium]
MPRRVLIVEDEAVFAKNLAAALKRINIDTVIASSYAEGVSQVGLRAYDLVCADINLGDGSGLDLADEVRRQNLPLPVLIMTGQDSVHHRTRAETAGTPAFLAKPFALSQFRELVASILEETSYALSGEALSLSGPRVIMYSHDTIGLGHMRRNSAIASELVARIPGISVLLVVGCPAGDVFSLPPGVDLIKLPAVTKVARDKWRSGSLRINAQDLLALRSGLILKTVEQFKPDVFVVDHEPNGVWGELSPVFDQIAQEATGPRMVLGLRDILDAPEVVLRRWVELGTNQLIPRTYDTVLIYGDEQIFPSAKAYGLDRMPGVQTHYCGYVSARSQHLTHGPFRQTRSANILIAGGGGRDAYPMMNAALSALAKIDPATRPTATVVTGPLMDAELTLQLKIRSMELGVRYLQSSHEMPALISRADLFVTMGGYNSMVEAVASGVPTVVVPRLGPSAEQRIRSELFEKLNLVSSISMEKSPVTALLNQFNRVRIHHPKNTPVGRSISLDGARTAARTIAALIDEKNKISTPSQSNRLGV